MTTADTWYRIPLKRALRPGGRASGLIKGQVATEPADGLVPGFSASGQDVWLEKAQFEGPGLVLSAVGARCGKVFEASGLWGVVANTSVLLPQPGHDAHFLWYLVNNEGFWEKGGTAQPYVRVPDTLERRVVLPCLAEQRVIANCLDVETARIDALIAKKRRIIELLRGRLWQFFMDQTWNSGANPIPLRRAFQFITDGPFGSAFTSDDYSAEGAAVVRLGNIGFAEYRPDDQAYIPIPLYHTFLRHKVHEGDLLIAGLGDARNHAGRACVAPDLGSAIVKGKCFCARVRFDIATPEYLALLLSSPIGADAVGLESRGSTRTMINLDIVKSAIMPLPPVVEQQKIVGRMAVERSRLRLLMSHLGRQVDLLMEHRQALITEAVTGVSRVPGMAA